MSFQSPDHKLKTPQKYMKHHSIPVLNMQAALSNDAEARHLFAASISHAWSTWGVFVLHGTGVDEENAGETMRLLSTFFAMDTSEKEILHLKHGGMTWRGYMPMGGERTHGTVDHKEGLYLGPDHGPDHPRVIAGCPLYGMNLLPDEKIPHLRPRIAKYIDEVTHLGNQIMEFASQSLGLPEAYIWDNVTCHDPLAIVRAFSYPAAELAPVTPPPPIGRGRTGETNEGAHGNNNIAIPQVTYGIGEHTDYGLLTMLRTDAQGLQFKHPEHGWVDVPHLPGSFVCSVGDVLDRLTGGRWKSRPHRARNLSPFQPRLSIPFFFDPSWDAMMRPLPLGHLPEDDEAGRQERWECQVCVKWDLTSIAKFEGPYSSFLAKKVSKVFPQLGPTAETLDSTRAASSRFAITII